MMQSDREAVDYSNEQLEPLFVGWFEQGDEEKREELWRSVELELLQEVERQMPYIRRVCYDHPSVAADELHIDVGRYARELAFQRQHRDAREPLGDVDKRLRVYWNDPDRRRMYPHLYQQIQYVVGSIVREAITHNPRLQWSQVSWYASGEGEINHSLNEPLSSDTLSPDVESERARSEIFREIYESGEFSADEKGYIDCFLGWEGDSPPKDSQIENALGWYQSKANRVKKSIAKKVRSYLNEIELSF